MTKMAECFCIRRTTLAVVPVEATEVAMAMVAVAEEEAAVAVVAIMPIPCPVMMRTTMPMLRTTSMTRTIRM